MTVVAIVYHSGMGHTAALAQAALQLGMIWVGHAENDPQQLNRLGGWTGVLGQANLEQSPAEAPGAADCVAGAALGRRVAEAALRWRRGIAVTPGTGPSAARIS